MKRWRYIPLTLLALLVWWPVWYLLMGALQSPEELELTVGPAISGQGEAVYTILPTWPTLWPLIGLLLDTPEFWDTFWNTVLLSVPQVLGQLLTAIPAAWALSRLRFRGRKVLTGLYILLMLMPFQVTMTPNFLVLDALGLMDTVWAVILPGIYSAFPVFIMLRFFDGIPRELLDSADLDGADHWETFWYIGLPLGRPGILAAMVLTFLESWSAVEQPLTFLRKERWLPLSLRIGQMELSQAMGAGLVALIPAVLVFRWGQKYLELGIRSGTMEEV
jgi:multiple sugar transport system permease protein